MDVQTIRLVNDFEGVKRLVVKSGGKLEIYSTKGTPPFWYLIEYKCKGIEKLQGNKPIFRNSHTVEISVENTNYPRSKPNAKFHTPIFHPNIFENSQVCLGDDYWTSAETLAELIIRIGKIIQ